MNKKYLLTLLIIMILITTGCGDEDSASQATTSGKSFIGGSQGLVMSFLPGAPPEEVFDKDFPFGINVKVDNIGEYDIENNADVTLQIIGIDPVDFGTTAGALIKDLDPGSAPFRGQNKDPEGAIIEGGTANFDFPTLQYASDVTGNPEFVLRANLCYKYGTSAISEICILEDLLGTTRKSGEEAFCRPTEDKSSESSAAPVGVDSFKQSVVGRDRLSFQFRVFHNGKGDVSKASTECSSEVADQDTVYVKVNTGLTGLTCTGLQGGPSSNEGYVKMFGSQGSEERNIICTQDLNPARTDQTKQIQIELEYEYEDHIDQKLVVQHIS